jgi:aryl-alcohol dehydrogenase-like predicted oxidoreductase
MQKRRLGRTDLSIAPMVFGGNVFGWTTDAKTAFALLDRFAAAGLNAIDTADVYSAWAPGNTGGESETIIGDWMKARGNRHAMTVVTKVGSPMGPGKKGLSARYIEEAVEASLKRLKVETIDLYLSHWPDEATPHEETLGAYQRLIAKGKIRWCGASNFNATQLAAALDASQARGLPRYEVLQPEYNLYDRDLFDGPLRDLCVAQEIGVITYYSLAKGFLSGKYRGEADLGQSPRGGGVKAYLNARGFRILAALNAPASPRRSPARPLSPSWRV